MEVVFQQFINGLSIAAIVALMAMGVTLIFGLTGLVMFAHGELLMIGGFVTWLISYEVGAGFWDGSVIALLAVGLIGFL